MDFAAFSPLKLQMLNQSSPRGSVRKRSLFPSNSPQSNDLGLISELCSDDSEVYSPPLLSPSSSLTPRKGTPMKTKMDQVLRTKNYLEFNDYSPQKTRASPRKVHCGKENIENRVMSARKSSRKMSLGKEKFDDLFVTVLPESPEQEVESSVMFKINSSDNFTTPTKKTLLVNNKAVRRSPRSNSKHEAMIKPTSFYGKVAPILATNQTNRIQGMKCVFRPLQQPRAKAKLLFEEKPAKKRERSKSVDAMREAKRRKAVFTGVHHAIPKPVKHSPPTVNKTRSESVREKALNLTDLSRTPYRMKKKQQQKEGWEHTLRFTKPMRYEETPNMGIKRKFFKTAIRDPICLSPSSPILKVKTPETASFIPKKRKLLDTRKSYLEENIVEMAKINASDISELIEDDDAEKPQDRPEVDDILLRLEEDDEEEKRKEAEKQMLMNILEDSPTKSAMMDTLSNCTASLDLNDSFSGSGNSKSSLDCVKENQTTPPSMFSMFNRSSIKALSDVTNQRKGSSSKKKWRGVGQDQLQIDAGQNRFGARQCLDCGMVYQAGEAEDEMEHNLFHRNLTKLPHAGWKNERIVGNFGLDYAIVITGDDPKSWLQKAAEVIALIDKSLGITSDISSVVHNHKVFLYISDKHIVGCMVASPVTGAYKMISSEYDVDICSEESYPVRCGISRMWTLYSHRRLGIASKLLDTVRRNFMYGNILSREEIAFSIPTPDGKRFATKYMETPNFLVYTGY